jgi:hypothetical protein
MRGLHKLAAASDLMNVRIKVNGELIAFNLYKEVRIEGNSINDDILSQPRLYSFLGAVHVQCVKAFEEAEANKKRIYATLYVSYKKKVGPGGRPNSDDLAKALTEKSVKYKLAVKKSILAKEQMQIILNCLEAFKQRKDLIQSLSSNIRNNV